MVFFSDKEGVPHNIGNPAEFLSERAIQRRIHQNISITNEDLPVRRSYVQGVKDAGAETLFTTRWLNGVLIRCEASLLPVINDLPYVSGVEYVAPPAEGGSGGRKSIQLKKNKSQVSVASQNQLAMIGIDRMHLAGYRGEGVVIAVLDSGFPGVDIVPAFEHLLSDGRVSEVSYDFVHNTQDVFHADDHGTEVLSVIAAGIPDGFTGGAPDATFQLFITEDVSGEYRIEEYNWLFAAERADSAGADIIHSSLGYYDFDDPSMNYDIDDMDGKTAVITRAAQFATDRGIVVIVSAGNEGNIPGWRIITAPADGKDVLAIGGVNSARQKVSSSSIGPSADGRIKPDLAALGASVTVVKANGQISTATGTSLAAPLVTALAAGIIQQFPQLSGLEVVKLMRQTASQANMPDHLLGYGIPNYLGVVSSQEHIVQIKPFEVYPNPVRDGDTLTIRSRDPDVFNSCMIEIVSSQGQVLAGHQARFDWLNRTYKATLKGLPAGIYYVRVSSGKIRDTFRVVKLR